MSLSISNAKGFSLVELMVAMVAGLLLVAAVMALFATVLRANGIAMKVSRLNQEVQAITDMMARDIQRAGYDASAAMHTLNPPVSGSKPPFYFDTSTDVNNSCIIVRYDGRDENAPSSANGSVNLKETVIYSYRADQSIWLVEPSASVSSPVSTSPACSSGGDRISTDGTIEISALTFTVLSGSVSTGARTIRLAITGNDKQSPDLKLTLQRDIKLRNDGY